MSAKEIQRGADRRQAERGGEAPGSGNDSANMQLVAHAGHRLLRSPQFQTGDPGQPNRPLRSGLPNLFRNLTSSMRKLTCRSS
jgi:hypothetical protein